MFEWCFPLMKKMTDETIIKITRKMKIKIPLPPFLLSIFGLFICFNFLRKVATKTHAGTVTL
ncbi:hypothetical protein DDP39_07315 [Helicobacter pylori]|nr:hypothetical protein DDP39_07315 [Helicobacter pylori]RKU93775.1 hypothetical protein DDP41_00830 [Helicobacter pylori]